MSTTPKPRRRFDCAPDRHADPSMDHRLVFDWDPVTCEVSGPGAGELRSLARGGVVYGGPYPRAAFEVGPDSLRSLAGLALLIGHSWHLPADLVALVPDCGPDLPELSYYDADGVLVLGRDRITF